MYICVNITNTVYVHRKKLQENAKRVSNDSSGWTNMLTVTPCRHTVTLLLLFTPSSRLPVRPVLFIPTLQMGKLRLKHLRNLLNQDHVIGKWQREDSNPDPPEYGIFIFFHMIFMCVYVF